MVRRVECLGRRDFLRDFCHRLGVLDPELVAEFLVENLDEVLTILVLLDELGDPRIFCLNDTLELVLLLPCVFERHEERLGFPSTLREQL